MNGDSKHDALAGWLTKEAEGRQFTPTQRMNGDRERDALAIWWRFPRDREFLLPETLLGSGEGKNRVCRNERKRRGGKGWTRKSVCEKGGDVSYDGFWEKNIALSSFAFLRKRRWSMIRDLDIDSGCPEKMYRAFLGSFPIKTFTWKFDQDQAAMWTEVSDTKWV